MQIRFAILTSSDRAARNERPDLTGPALADVIRTEGWEIVIQSVQEDDMETLKNTLIKWVDRGDIDVILINGGTGFSPRDVTPEATLAVIDREAPGLAEAMRAASMRVTNHAMLSRGVTGIRGKTLIVDLPGSPSAALENIKVILPVLHHALELLRDDPASESHHRDHT
jgi:molybdopterin adenylyltransferase